MRILQKLVYFLLFHTLHFLKWKKAAFQKNLHILSSTASYSNTLSHLVNELLNILFKSTYSVNPIDEESKKLLNEIKSKKGILLTAHIGNHEYFGQYLKSSGIDLRAFHQELNSPYWNEKMNEYRVSQGNYSPYSDKQTLQAIKDFKSTNYLVAFLWDQHTQSQKSIKVKLGAKEYSANKLPSLFFTPEVPIYFGYLYKSSNSYSLTLKELGKLEDYPILLEQSITTHPEQYYGIFHKIFKSSTHYN
jgi:lauroyl/myristoyl acyltransferase